MNQEILFRNILKNALGKDFSVLQFSALSGGCINEAYSLKAGKDIFFIKLNRSDDDMFSCEARGLEMIRNTGIIPVPQPIAWGREEGWSFLLLEFIQRGFPSDNFWKDFGTALAQLHSHTAECYGLDFNNYIGSLPQNNEWMNNDIEFFIERRLRPQVELGARNNKFSAEIAAQFDEFYKMLPELLCPGPPALLHGDLWSGNFMVNEKGKAVLIDPAVYYGHREAEIAFTRLFGGFDKKFYKAYHEVFPAEGNIKERMNIYNLYPLLVHVNLFGGGYLSEVKSILKNYEL